MTLESSRRSTLAAHSARRDAYIQGREDEKERRKREKLRKVAPGFEPSAGVLVPTRNSVQLASSTDLMQNKGEKDVMDDLVEQLARLESKEP